MKNQISVAVLNISQASLLTGRTRETVMRAARDLPSKDGRGNAKNYDSRQLLQALYIGTTGPTYSEAMRRLTLERTTQIELANAKFRGEFYPVEWVHFTMSHATAIVVQTLKGNVNRLLTFEVVNDVLAQFREAFAQMRGDGDELEKEYEKEKNEKAQATNGSGERPGVQESNRRGDDSSVPADQISAR